MTISEIYEAARERGLVSSMRCFSQQFLGRAANYASDRGLDRCSAGALLHLYRHLGELGEVELQAMAFQRMLDAEARNDETRATVRQ
jgi:aldehyde:ferredoxin oxidoreductase